jgi:two-component system sensor histidine kinase RegB
MYLYNRPLPLATPKQHLHHLVIIRTVVLFCLYLSSALSYLLTDLLLPYGAILFVLLLLSLVNALTLARLKRELPVTDIEFFSQLLIDVICLSLLFYFSGGANNPFVFYFLVPICISAASLSLTFTWSITLLCISSYTLLLFFFVPLPALSPEHIHHATNTSIIDLHVLGMWVNFFISAVLITYFVVRMARDLRHQDQLLIQRREDQLRDEQLMAVATLAAGTAHELGTPLSTMKMLLNELRAEYKEPLALQADLQILTAQVAQCADTLHRLAEKAEETKTGDFSLQTVRSFCLATIERWQIMRPDAIFKIRMDDDLPDISYVFHPTIPQSIINLLNNAADANPVDISIKIEWDQQVLTWYIEDNGPGVPLELADQLGKAFFSTKGDGLGLGLFLTHATLDRYGGEVRLYNRKPKGTVTKLVLPLTGHPLDNIMSNQ